MQQLIDKFVKLINYRDKVLEDKFGKNRVNAFNFPENRFWYADHVSPIDKEIVEAGNNVLLASEAEATLKTIADVFGNKTLADIYLGQTEQKDGDEIIQ